MNYVLGFQNVSTLLFIYTLDDIHQLFTGAMCATGFLFSQSGKGVASALSGLPVQSTMVGFYAGCALMLLASAACLFSGRAFFRYLHSLAAAALLFVTMAGMISFVSIYIYELPTHHCPFDILQQEYGYIGYLLYITLFCGVFYGLLPGIFQPLKNIASLQEALGRIERTWIMLAIGCISGFVSIATCQMAASNLTYIFY